MSLSEVVTADVLRPLAVGTEAQDHLSPHLPPSQESPQEVLTSPQFQQALGVFGSALHSGQLGPLMAQFGMGEEVAKAASTGGEFTTFEISKETRRFKRKTLMSPARGWGGTH